LRQIQLKTRLYIQKPHDMKLVADESVDFGIIIRLRQKGIVVVSIYEDYSGIKDTEVLKIANDNQCLLITEDKDFGELTYRLKLEHNGILLIRLCEIPRKDRLNIVPDVIEKRFDKLENNFSVLTKRGLRIKTAHNTRL
jgi:predicted nuclease of predicted toxin-antitoxin system